MSWTGDDSPEGDGAAQLLEALAAEVELLKIQRLFDRCYYAEVKIIWEFSGSIRRDLAELFYEFRSLARDLNLRAPTADRDFVESALWPCPRNQWTEMCVYDHDADPEHDTCVFCGAPEERK